MSTSDSDFYDTKKNSPEPEEAPIRQRGCLFYGCLISGSLALLLLFAIGLTTYVLYRTFTEFVEENTATVRRELPKVDVPRETRLAIQEKVKEFEEPLDTKEPTQALVLTADELNALIDESPDLRGQIYLTIEGDRVKGKLSISLDQISKFLEQLRISTLRGRYFNGEVEFKGSFSEGTLKLTIESLEANGQRLSEPFVTQVNDMIVGFSKNPKNADELDKIESVEIKDGKVIIKRRVKNKRPKAGASPSPLDEPAKEP